MTGTRLPIETAPRDGTDIIVFYEIGGQLIAHIAFWNCDEHDQWKYQGFDSKDEVVGWWSYTANSVGQTKLKGCWEPTEWIPLPEPRRGDGS